jgi:hypothetical protein
VLNNDYYWLAANIIVAGQTPATLIDC